MTVDSGPRGIFIISQLERKHAQSQVCPIGAEMRENAMKVRLNATSCFVKLPHEMIAHHKRSSAVLVQLVPPSCNM